MKLLTDIEFVFNVRFIRDNQIEFICVSMLTNREQTTKIHRLTHGQTVESCFYNLLIFWSWIKLNQLNEDKWIVDCPNAYDTMCSISYVYLLSLKILRSIASHSSMIISASKFQPIRLKTDVARGYFAWEWSQLPCFKPRTDKMIDFLKEMNRWVLRH